MKTIELSMFDIELDDQIQPRVEQKEEVILEYAENLANGSEFPPVDVFYDGETYWLADGFHRYEAYSLESRDTIPAIIYKGGRREAIIHAAGANATHGVPRSNADKRRVVGNMLIDPEFNIESDNTIAEWCKVSQPFVSKMRKELTYNGYKFESKRKCADGRMMETTNIGAKPQTEDSQTVEESESPRAGMESSENKEEEQVQASEQDDAESSAETNADPAPESDELSGQESAEDEDEQDIKESSDSEEEEISLNDETVESDDEGISSVVEPEDSSNEGETENFEPESAEAPTDELAGITDVATLKAKIVELQNTIKEKDQQLQQKEELIIELKQKVSELQDTIKYYKEELFDSIKQDSGYSSSMVESPNYQPMLSA